jgi:hypothetical protein
VVEPHHEADEKGDPGQMQDAHPATEGEEVESVTHRIAPDFVKDLDGSRPCRHKIKQVVCQVASPRVALGFFDASENAGHLGHGHAMKGPRISHEVNGLAPWNRLGPMTRAHSWNGGARPGPGEETVRQSPFLDGEGLVVCTWVVRSAGGSRGGDPGGVPMPRGGSVSVRDGVDVMQLEMYEY